MKLTQKMCLQVKDNYRFILFIALMLVFRSAVADWNSVPTGSMKPTIVEGDRILVNKMAYDLRLPFTNISLLKLADPQRGDVVIFDSQVSDIRLVKRVIGLPGDTVEMQDNALIINGEQLSYQALSLTASQADSIEYLPGMKHQIRVRQNGSTLSSFREVTVPQGHYLVLGDNRDNSTDSRVIGFVPRHEIVGRSKTVVMSFDYDNYYLPRGERYLHTL
ncbi:signal peptidase I [Thalassomonas sp. RHCl1]|uniref:signal peptidase I n=1 Tax=Thalassomonas sp. RHCl1 TaxID=2995320 RepID=UPI00248B6BEE|nr:signal peptidase I [Thalassomonas sp. RHCl1]